MISIRPANLDDAGAIAHVHVETWRTTYSGIVPDAYLAGLDETLRAKLWHEWLNGQTAVLVAERAGRVVGFAHAGKIREPVGTCDAELYAIYLLREAQGKGIGSDLLNAAAAAMEKQGFGSMAVWVLEQNRARAFYEKCGATLANTRVIAIGGARLMEVAYSWPDLKSLVR